MPMRCESTVYL